MTNTSGKDLFLAKNLHRNSNDAAILVSKNLNPEVKASMNPEGMDVKKHEKRQPKN